MKLNSINNYLKYFYIGGAILFSKLFLLFIPYLTDETNYNIFNKIYYSAAIIVLFSKLGFEFAINRIQLSHRKIFLSVFVNTLIIIILMILIDQENYSTYQYASIFLYAYFTILANIFMIKNLFEGSYKKYFFYKLSFGVTLIFLLIVLLKLQIEIFWLFPLIGIFWFGIIYFFNILSSEGKGKLGDFYKIGLASFVINGALGIAFITDKYIVNHFFNIEVANAYTFAWAITAPMLYIGNMIEHSIFTLSDQNKRTNIIKSTLLLILLVVIYASLVLVVMNFFIKLIPTSIDQEYFLMFLPVFLILYSIYTIFHFPLNGILFKFINDQAQLKLAKFYPPLVFFYLFLIYYTYFIALNKNYWYLIILNISYLLIVIFIKAIVIKKSLIDKN